MAFAGLAALAVGGAVACDPGGLSTATVSYTTDRTATAELQRRHVGVRWLTCTGDYGDRSGASGGPAPSATGTTTTVVAVDCQGRTTDDRRITVTGRVTRAVGGACVRGDLVAAVDGDQVFRVDGLGDCGAAPSAVGTPPAGGGVPRPGPTVTVTVTRTIWCVGDPSCGPVEGK
ncbi:hypothetical protein AB0F77_13970 [Streptomyces sp. NPDC026672]|uniref:hypothetical protein n=1 Tax=unclassified Streptomyces TaxID=2593676 RepID=UPI0033FD752F